jgi:hypothetical protein
MDPIDDARRLLLQCLDVQPRTTKTLLYGKQAKETTGAFLPIAGSSDDLNWIERRRHWARWIVESTAMADRKDRPIIGDGKVIGHFAKRTTYFEKENKKVEVESSAEATTSPPEVLDQVDTELIESLLFNPQSTSKELKKSRSSVRLAPEVQLVDGLETFSETTATFGQILHEAEDASVRRRELRSVLSHSQSSTFWPSTLSLSDILARKEFNKPVSGMQPNFTDPKLKHQFFLRFRPVPLHGSDGEELRFPSIEIAARPEYNLSHEVDEVTGITPKGQDSLRIFYWHAIVEENVVDLMRPRLLTDIRFKRQVMPTLKLAEQKQAFQEFLTASQMNLDDKGPLKTPKGLTLRLPKRLGIVSDSRTGNEDTNSLLTDDDEVEVEYLFTGLDFRQQIELDYQGFRLRYIEIEAGKAGGRRRELVLVKDDVRPERSASENDDESSTALEPLTFNDFVTAAVDLSKMFTTIPSVANRPEPSGSTTRKVTERSRAWREMNAVEPDVQ